MRLLLVSDTYPPARISGALQMHELAHAIAALGHSPLVLTPASRGQVGMEYTDGVQVLRVRAPSTKDVPYWRRVLAELLLPWVLLRGLERSVIREDVWDGVVWYSPTIFLGPLVKAVKERFGCPSYLISRDLFPDWAADAGVLRRGGFSYRFLKAIERFQYRQADIVGVQTGANVPLVARDAPNAVRIEVLQNWLSAPVMTTSQHSPSLGVLEGRVNFVYAGNMGVAQDLDAFVDLAHRMRARDDVGFVFIGRGSEVQRLRSVSCQLPNLIVLDEVTPEVLQELLLRCHVGIIALHPAHDTHNIPGKLITYLHAGLPVLARVNPGNDLLSIVDQERLGYVVAGNDPCLLHDFASQLADRPHDRVEIGNRARIFATKFSPETTAVQITQALRNIRRDNLHGSVN